MRKKYKPFTGCHFRNSLCKGEIKEHPTKPNKWYCEFHQDIFDAIQLILFEQKQEKV